MFLGENNRMIVAHNYTVWERGGLAAALLLLFMDRRRQAFLKWGFHAPWDLNRGKVKNLAQLDQCFLAIY